MHTGKNMSAQDIFMNPIFPNGNVPDTVLGPVMAKLVDLIGEKLGGRLLEIRHMNSVLVLSLSLENYTIFWSHITIQCNCSNCLYISKLLLA